MKAAASYKVASYKAALRSLRFNLVHLLWAIPLPVVLLLGSCGGGGGGGGGGDGSSTDGTQFEHRRCEFLLQSGLRNPGDLLDLEITNGDEDSAETEVTIYREIGDKDDGGGDDAVVGSVHSTALETR